MSGWAAQVGRCTRRREVAGDRQDLAGTRGQPGPTAERSDAPAPSLKARHWSILHKRDVRPHVHFGVSVSSRRSASRPSPACCTPKPAKSNHSAKRPRRSRSSSMMSTVCCQRGNDMRVRVEARERQQKGAGVPDSDSSTPTNQCSGFEVSLSECAADIRCKTEDVGRGVGAPRGPRSAVTWLVMRDLAGSGLA